MNDVRFYNFSFSLLHVENKIKSANWKIMYNGVGSFEMHFSPRNSALASLCMNNRYLVAVQGDLQAVVTSFQIDDTDAVIYGKTVNYMLYNGVTPDFDSLGEQNVEWFARKFVEDALGVGNNGFITLGDPTGEYTDTFNFWRNTYHQTFDVVKDVLDLDGGGHEVVFDWQENKWVFNVLYGVQLPFTLSYSNRNISALSYTQDFQNDYTGAWYQQAQEAEGGETPAPVWTYIEKPGGATGAYKRSCVLTQDNEAEALEELNKKNATKETKVTAQRLKYNVDYSLGDTCRLAQSDAGIPAQNVRIVGVQLWFEVNNTGEAPILEVI